MLGELSSYWHQSDWEDWAGIMLDYPSTPRDSYWLATPRDLKGQEHAIDEWTSGQRSTPVPVSKVWTTPEFSMKRKNFTNLGTAEEPDLEGITGTMYNPTYRPPSRGGAGGRSPLKANHDLRLTFPDSDSGFSSSLRTRSGGYGLSSLTDDGFGSPPRGRLMRSRSLSRLTDSCELESPPFSPRAQDPGYRRPDLTGSDLIIKGLKEKLEESENRRTVLMSKLKEAQSTLQAQGDRLDRIENTAKENEFVVEDLKIKEQEYRQKIGDLEREQDEKDFLRLENLRLREDMQTRITSLGHQLKTLQSQHSTTEAESNKRNSLLEQTSKALNLLEEESAKFQMERDSAVSEMKAAKDQFHVIKTKFALIEEENTQMKATLTKITEEYQALQVSAGESGSKVEELSSLVQTLRNENERLTTVWESSTQEKQKLVQQQDKLEEVLGELRCQLMEAKQEKDSSLEEKLELKKQHQQLITDKEHLMKTKISLEEQLNEQQGEVTAARLNQSRSDEERRQVEEELKAVKKVSEDLSSELSGVKASYERAVEQVNLLENGKRIVNQQQHLLEQEISRLDNELQNTKDNLQSKEADFRMERNHLEETAQKYKDELRGLKVAKGQAEDKCRELEIKLKRANEELQQSVSVQQSELESWRNTCERLTGSVSRKEAELQSLSDKCGDLEDLVSKLKRECKVYEDQLEECLEAEDMGVRLREDNRRLLQEKAENEQMIQLLEMQKEVLTKSSESNLARLREVDQLMGRMDQLRNENTLLRDRIVELEKLRDNLMKQRDDSSMNASSVLHNTDGRQGNSQLKALTDQNDHLQHVNQVLTKNMEKLEQENSALRLRANVNTESVPRETFDRLQRDKSVVENEFSMLQEQHKELTDRHQRFVISYGHNNSENKSDAGKEKAALEKQVAYLQGQMILCESSKKRAEETARELREQVQRLEQQLEASQNGQSSSKQTAELEKSLKESKKKRESLEALVRSLKQELMQEKKTSSADDPDGEVCQLHEELEKLTDVLNNKEERIEHLDRQVADLRRELQKARELQPNCANGQDTTDAAKTQKGHLDKDQSRPSNAKSDRKPVPQTKSSPPRSPVLSEPMPHLAKSAGVPATVDKSGGMSRRMERPGVNKRQVKSNPAESCAETSQHITDQVFKPPSRNVHPRLQTLIERYKDSTDAEDDAGSNVTPQVRNERSKITSDKSERSKVTTPNKGEGSNITTPGQSEGSKVTQQVRTRGWPYKKLQSLSSVSKGSVEKSSQEAGNAKTGNTEAGNSAENGGDTGSSSGNGVREGEQKATSLMDSQEQRDISALIQKRVHIPRPLLTVRPPKLTSQVVASLLSRGSPTSPSPTLAPPLSATL